MIAKIWRRLAQILFYHNDLAAIIKPFFENLKNESINDQKYISFLKTFSQNQLKVLYQNEIIPKEKFYSIISEEKEDNKSDQIERIISDDKINELQELLQGKDIQTFNTIIKSFNEVEKMKIPLIQFCIMKKAIECFKFLLINGYENPSKIREESNPGDKNWESKHRYEWDCMATAIYLGDKQVMKILEDKEIIKGENPAHLEAAILSYRNSIAKEIIENINNSNIIKNHFNLALLASSKNNNIKGAELLISKGADIDTQDNYYQNLIIVFVINYI